MISWPLLLVFLSAPSSWAEGAPGWITKTPTPSESHVFVTGRGEGPTFSEARALAEIDARAKVVRMFSGVYSSTQETSTETLDRVDYRAEHRQGSDLVFVRQLEEIEHFQDSGKAGIAVHLLMRIPKSETFRMGNMAATGTRKNSGILSIDSEPKGAQVLIDEAPFGVTPAKAILQNGVYRVKLHLAGYRTVERIVEMKKGERVSLNLPMQSNQGRLRLEGGPSGASLEVNGVSASFGQTIELPGGAYRIKVEKEGYLTFKKDGVIPHGGSEVLFIELTKRDRLRSREGLSEKSSFSAGRKAIAKRDYREAKRIADELKRNTKGLSGSLLEAELLSELGLKSRAFLVYSRAARNAGRESDPTVASNLCEFGGAARLESDFAGAYEVGSICKRVIEDDPLNAGAYAALGKYLEGSGQWLEARRMYLSAARLDPHYSPLIHNLCVRQEHYFRFLKNIKCRRDG